jgi:hypothetical protein
MPLLLFSKSKASVVRSCVIACVVVFGWGADQAWASCGDYLHRGSARTSAMPNEVLADKGNGMSHPPVAHLPVAPCSGPACRQQSPTPILPLTPIVSFDRGLDSLLARFVELPNDPIAAAQILPAEGSLPDVFPGRVDRPPKF